MGVSMINHKSRYWKYSNNQERKITKIYSWHTKLACFAHNWNACESSCDVMVSNYFLENKRKEIFTSHRVIWSISRNNWELFYWQMEEIQWSNNKWRIVTHVCFCIILCSFYNKYDKIMMGHEWKYAKITFFKKIQY